MGRVEGKVALVAGAGGGIGGAQLETVAGIDLDRIHEPATDEFGAGDERQWRADVLLQ